MNIKEINFLLLLFGIFIFLFSSLSIVNAETDYGYNFLDVTSLSSSGGNVSSVTSSTNCITIDPTTDDVIITFNTSCAGSGTTYTAGSNLTLVGNEFSVDTSSLKNWLDTLYSSITWGYNQTTPAIAYTDLIVSNNNASWSSTYNATYEMWAYNQSVDLTNVAFTNEANVFTENQNLNDNDLNNVLNIDGNGNLDIFPNNQFSLGLRIDSDGNNLLLTALGTNNVNFSDNIINSGNVKASNFFGNLNWSYIQNTPNFITDALIGLWDDNNVNDLLVSNGTNVGYNESIFNQSVLIISSVYNNTNALLSINTTTNLQNLLNSTGIYSTYNATYNAKNTSVFLLSDSNAYYNGGSVGIGTATPKNKLDVVGNLVLSQSNALLLGRGDTQNNSINIYNSTDGIMIFNTHYGTSSIGGYLFRTNSGDKVFIRGDGNVGIGTSSPSTKLNVIGNTNITQNLTIGSRVGIGREATFYKLELGSNTNTATMAFVEGANNAGGGGLRFVKSRGTSYPNSGDFLGAIQWYGNDEEDIPGAKQGAYIAGVTAEAWTDSAAGTNIVFATTNVGTTSLTQKATILNNGNLGVGTATPANTLNVIGTFNVTNSSGTLGLFQDSNGKVGIGTEPAFALTQSLQVDGKGIYTAGDILVVNGFKLKTALGTGTINIGSSSETITLPSLAGTGNDYACLDSNGLLYRSAGACT